MKKQMGFTMIELVISIALIGILAFVVVSRFSNVQSFQGDANYDQIKFLLKTGQQTAISQKRNIYPIFNSGELSLCYVNTNPCTSKLSIGNKNYVVNIDSANLTIPAFYFNLKGNTDGGKLTIVVSGKNLYIEEETGFIHE